MFLRGHDEQTLESLWRLHDKDGVDVEILLDLKRDRIGVGESTVLEVMD